MSGEEVSLGRGVSYLLIVVEDYCVWFRMRIYLLKSAVGMLHVIE